MSFQVTVFVEHEFLNFDVIQESYLLFQYFPVN